VDGNCDALAVAGKCFIYGVVDQFVYEVVQAVRAGTTDIHRRTVADGVEALERFDIFCGIVLTLHRDRAALLGQQ
jgi:hypothetical protein